MADPFALLDRLTDLERTPTARPYGEREYDLAGFRRWVAELGNPQDRTPWVHIAGTKGKGSTAALTESILRAAGARTGLFTSPHLEHFGQRFRFDGRPWTLDEFANALRRFAPLLSRRPAEELEGPHSLRTVFELLTALAFVEFGEWHATAGILEVGLGGRLDCTNIIAPAVTVITPIGLDHTKQLGSTIEEIAGEKAGILKPDRPAVVFAPTSERQARARDVVLERARQVGAPILEGTPVRVMSREVDGQIVEVSWREKSVTARLPLLGDHQAANLGLAITAAETLASAIGIDLTADHVATGASAVHWPGRLEIARGRPPLVLDGAHCPLSALALGRALHHLGFEPFTWLWGMQRDKDAAAFVHEFTAAAPPGAIRRVLAYQVPGGRGAQADVLARIARDAGLEAEVAPDPNAAFNQARQYGDAILAAGTLYTLSLFANLSRGKNHGPES